MSGHDSRSPAEWRRVKIAQIHVAKKQLDMDEDSYRDMLERVAGVRSAIHLDLSGIRAVLDEFRRLGFQPSYKGAKRRTTPAPDREAMVGKVKAQLAAAGRQDAYADGISQRAFQVERFEWLKPEQLYRLIAMLSKDAARHGRGV